MRKLLSVTLRPSHWHRKSVLLVDENQRIEISRKPLGVVAATIPWNYPLLNPWVSTTIRFKQLN
ncbi:MAG: aldehyde dehydrogenase family protein [Halioglobus sp.]